MELYIYQIKIKGEEGITLHIYQQAPLGAEDQLLDFMWQEYYEFQPDKNLYRVLNLTAENNKFCVKSKTLSNMIHFHLAMRIYDYVEEYS